MNKRLLLISNSTSFGQGYLDHCADEIADFLQGVKKILFVPYALYDMDKYTKLAQERYAKMEIELKSIHKTKSPKQAIENAQALFIGGGNTFRLLNEIYKVNIIEIIRKKVQKGMPYIGTSAGANLACPTIKTTNDMPIVYPPSFDALNLVPFQINPHYLDADQNFKHKGETREQRIREFHEENDTPVIGLREGAWLRIENKSIRLKGTTGARFFEKVKEPVELNPNSRLNFL